MKQLRNRSSVLQSVGPRLQRGQQIEHISWSMWFYPTMIILSIIAASLVTFIFTDVAVRPMIIIWFLFVCPGMTVVRFFQLHEVVIEWLLALALSIALDAFIAGVLLYAGWWSPLSSLVLLIGFCLIGSLLQFIFTFVRIPLPF